MSSLKIAMVTDNYFPKTGGVEYCVDALGRYIAELGHEVTIITRKMPKQPIEEKRGLLFVRRVSYYEMLAALAGVPTKKINFSQFDVVHAHSLTSILAILALLLAKKISKPSILTSHSLYRTLDKWPVRCIGQLVNHVICVSQAVRAEMRSMKKNIVTYYIPNGFDRVSPNGLQGINPLQKQDNDIIIGTVSRLTTKKAVTDFITIAYQLLKTHKNLKFVIIGDGPVKKKLQAQAQKYHISERIVFTGNISRAATLNLIKQMDIFVLTSPHEAFGMVILEAIYHKIPVVARNNNGIEDIITSRKTGYLSSSSEVMLHDLHQLINNSALRTQLGENAYPMVENFRWDDIAQKTVSVYQALIKETASF